MTIEPKICGICGKEYQPQSNNSKFCSTACRKENIRRLSAQYWQNEKKVRVRVSKPEKSLPKKKTASLSKITAELAEYNKRNGTTMSYGKYVLMKEMGTI